MTPMSTLRKQPCAENLPALFSIQRTLNIYSDIVSALPTCAQKIRESLGQGEVVVAFSGTGDRGMGIVAVINGSPRETQVNAPIRMGSFPCGRALEKEELVAFDLDTKEHCIESPIWSDNKIVGVVSLVIDPCAKNTNGKKTCDNTAKELVQWTCYLVEEALGLRGALLRKAKDGEAVSRGGVPGTQSIPDITLLDSVIETGKSGNRDEIAFHGIIGASDRMKDTYTLINQVSGTEATVLITGESGTGKELVAKAIHECSKRSNGPFIAVNCSALPESIIESELFGHEKGAFTGAIAAREGRFEAAKNGTLFLDEIGDLSQAVQVKLLRILQERSFERVGGNKSIKTNARIITATHRDLLEEVRSGRFREDLFFRLNVFPIHLPPLRERGADILLLADCFAEKFSANSGKEIKRISSPALDLLMIYHWPGNVRELENCISRAGIVSTDGVIHSYNLPPSLQSATSTGTEPTSTFDGAIARLEKEMLIEALKIERGNSVPAARRLGITERRFRFALQHYKLDYHSFRTKL